MVSAVHRSELERPPRSTVDSTAWKAWLCPLRHFFDASGLQPTSKGWRVKYFGGKRTIVDGPFTEAKELIAGYTLIQVKSRQEAIEWSRRFPQPHH